MRKIFYIFLIILVGGVILFYSAASAEAAAPRITTPSSPYLPDGIDGQSYSFTFGASDGIPPYTWRTPSRVPMSRDFLPQGLSLSSSGVLSGTPRLSAGATKGEYTFSVEVADRNGQFAIGIFYLTVLSQALPPGTSPQITSISPLRGGMIYQPYNYQLEASGGTPPYEWFKDLGDLPPGISLSSSGLLSGTPTQARNYTFSVWVRDRVLTRSDSKNFVLTISPNLPLQISPSSLPGGNLGQPYSQTISATGGIPPYIWTLTVSEPVPTWLNYNISGNERQTLSISGVPTNLGIFRLYVELRDSSLPIPRFDWKIFDINIGMAAAPPPGTAPTLGRTCLSPMSIKEPKLYQGNGKTVAYDGLVPCGKCVLIDPPLTPDGKPQLDANGFLTGSNSQYVSCQFCHFFVMFDGIVDFLLFNIVVPLAILFLIIGGLMFVFSAGNPARVEKGKSIITSVVIGLIIIFAAWIFINVFFMFIGVAEWTGLRAGWFNFPCTIKLP